MSGAAPLRELGVPPTLPTAEQVLPQARGENFPVALRWLPRRFREPLLAIYGFARLVDDCGDEIAGDRAAALDEIDREIDRIYTPTATPRPRPREPHHPLLRRLAAAVRGCGLPEAPLRRLVEANRRDQGAVRYRNYEELRAYCALSADPVGHLVLCVFGAAIPANLRSSDAICTALQIVEHCQDVAEDYRRGRIYLPEEDLLRFGCQPAELAAPRAGPALRRVIRFEIERVRGLLRSGEPLVAALRGWARLAVAGYVAGGYAAAAAVERQGWDVLRGPTRPRRRDQLRLGLRVGLFPRRPERERGRDRERGPGRGSDPERGHGPERDPEPGRGRRRGPQ